GDIQAVSEDFFEEYELLYEAAESGLWRKATPSLVNRDIITNDEWETGLSIAVANNQLKSVKEIMMRMPPEVLNYATTITTTTALHYAAMYGYTEHAKLLVKSNPSLTQIRDEKGRVPLQVAVEAVTTGQKETVKYLYSMTEDTKPSPFSGDDGAKLLCSTIEANFYDIALSIVERFPKLVTKKSVAHEICGLESIIQRPFAFKSGSKLTWWQHKIYPLIPVDKNSTYNHGAQANKQSISRGLEGTEIDVENSLENSGGTLVAEDNPSKHSKVYSMMMEKGAMAVFASVNCIPYISRVLHIKQYLHQRKLMHKQALALVKEMFAQLDKKMDERQSVKYFRAHPNILKTAIKHGTIEVVEECLEQFPSLIWEDIAGQTMIQMAISERNEKIFDLICETSEKEQMDLVSRKDKMGNTLLHQTAKLAPRAYLHSVCGTALQVQRELQWFKGVESLIPEEDRVKRNKKGITAQYLFTEQHKKLVEEGGEWMKDTSGSCMVVAALIATVAFAAVFTVPGGNISDNSDVKNGVPVFLGKTPFTVFIIADALALFSSITSVLMFLAIYTSRHAEEDFIKSLPQKLILGLATLFISMATILVAFGASLFIVVGDRFGWSLIPIGIFGCVPLSLFASLQLPLFVEMVISTFWSNLFQKHKYL
ncbi:hypothetical protein MKW92_046979, partial [Papaver armeniacum]